MPFDTGTLRDLGYPVPDGEPDDGVYVEPETGRPVPTLVTLCGSREAAGEFLRNAGFLDEEVSRKAQEEAEEARRTVTDEQMTKTLNRILGYGQTPDDTEEDDVSAVVADVDL